MKKIYLIAVIVAIVAGFATYFFAVQIKENSSIKDVEKVNVVVASTDIKRDTVLTEDMLLVVQIPVSSVTGGTVTNLNEIIGHVSLTDFTAGEQILASRVALVGAVAAAGNQNLSYQIEKGKYAYAIPIDELNSVLGFVREGDYVDIFQCVEGKTEILLEKVKIQRLGGYTVNLQKDQTGNEIMSYSQVVLFLTRAEIIKINNATLNGAQFKMALVPYEVGAGLANIPEDVSDVEISTNPPGIVTTTLPETTEAEE